MTDSCNRKLVGWCIAIGIVAVLVSLEAGLHLAFGEIRQVTLGHVQVQFGLETAWWLPVLFLLVTGAIVLARSQLRRKAYAFLFWGLLYSAVLFPMRGIVSETIGLPVRPYGWRSGGGRDSDWYYRPVNRAIVFDQACAVMFLLGPACSCVGIYMVILSDRRDAEDPTCLCGYSLRGRATGDRCPECGRTPWAEEVGSSRDSMASDDLEA